MGVKKLSEFEQARAKKLAQDLAEKIGQYFPEPPQEARIAEVAALREQLEKMGFKVIWSASIDAKTLKCDASVELLLPILPDDDCNNRTD